MQRFLELSVDCWGYLQNVNKFLLTIKQAARKVLKIFEAADQYFCVIFFIMFGTVQYYV